MLFSRENARWFGNKCIPSCKLTRQHICRLFGEAGVYYEVYIEMPFALFMSYWLFHWVAKDGWTNWDSFSGPYFDDHVQEVAEEKHDFQKYSDEEDYYVQLRHEVVKDCGDDYKPYLGNDSMSTVDAGKLYWNSLNNNIEEVFYKDLRSVRQSFIASAALHILTNAFLVLACSMGIKGDPYSLIVATVADIIPHILMGMAVFVFQEGRFCILEVILKTPIRRIMLTYYLIRIAIGILKSCCVITYVKHMWDIKNRRIERKVSSRILYQTYGAEAELGISPEIFTDEYYIKTLHHRGETSSDELERYRAHKLLMDAVNASLNASTSSLDLRQIGRDLLEEDSNRLSPIGHTQMSSSIYSDAIPRIQASMMSLTTRIAESNISSQPNTSRFQRSPSMNTDATGVSLIPRIEASMMSLTAKIAGGSHRLSLPNTSRYKRIPSMNTNTNNTTDVSLLPGIQASIMSLSSMMAHRSSKVNWDHKVDKLPEKRSSKVAPKENKEYDQFTIENGLDSLSEEQRRKAKSPAEQKLDNDEYQTDTFVSVSDFTRE